MYAACPQQKSGSDCGVYVVACAFYLARSTAPILSMYICPDAWRYATAQVLQHMDGGETARRLSLRHIGCQGLGVFTETHITITKRPQAKQAYCGWRRYHRSWW